MTELTFYHTLLIAMFIFTIPTYISLQFIAAPYGNDAEGEINKWWGPVLPAKPSWFFKELPAFLAPFTIIFFINDFRNPHAVFFFIWSLHYGYRVFIYPFTIKSKAGAALVIFMMSIIFNCINAYLNFRFFEFAERGWNWFYTPQFIFGCGVFIAGRICSIDSDYRLTNLRQPGETGHKIPYGGMFKYVSCPNFLGEIITWTGWTILTWSPAGLFFAAFTLANLGPKARRKHLGYIREFPEYPWDRNAVFPIKAISRWLTK